VKRTRLLLRIAAVVSSVLLAGGFVCYRAGAFDRLIRTSANTASSSRQLLEPDGKGDNEQQSANVRSIPVAPSLDAQAQATLMSGSKSFSPSKIIAGLTPAPAMVNDLDIPLAPAPNKDALPRGVTPAGSSTVTFTGRQSSFLLGGTKAVPRIFSGSKIGVMFEEFDLSVKRQKTPTPSPASDPNKPPMRELTK
jgi:hypothetical protein